MNTPAIGHALAVVPGCVETLSSDEGMARTATRSPRLGLSWLDELATTAFVSGETSQLVSLVRDSAEALAGPDRNEARMRLLARSIAVTRAHESALEQLLGERLAARDERGTNLVNKVLTATTRRLAALLAEHRMACAVEPHRTMVAVGHADRVTVKTVR